MDEENNSSKEKIEIKVVEASRVEVVMLIACIVFMLALILFFIFTAPGFDFSDPDFEEIQDSEMGTGLKNFSDEEISNGFPILINTATKEDLQKIPNIGPVMAQKIIDFRNQRGTIVKISDLLSVEGIGKKTLAILEEYCIVN